MAGLDGRGRTNFIGVLCKLRVQDEKHTTQQDPVRLTTDVAKTIQMVSDTLLLVDRTVPVSMQPLRGCADCIAGRSKLLSVAASQIEGLAYQDTIDTNEISQKLAIIAECCSTLVEAVAQTVFILGLQTKDCQPGIPALIDAYPFVRGRLAVELALDVLVRPLPADAPPLQHQSAMGVAAVVATQLEAVQDECIAAMDRSPPGWVKAQIAASSRAVNGTVAAFVECTKSFVDQPTDGKLKCLKAFATPLLNSFEALEVFAASDSDFAGRPPYMNNAARVLVKALRAAALSCVSSCALLLKAIKDCLTEPQATVPREKLTRYTISLEDSLSTLSAAMNSIMQASNVLASPVVPLEKLVHTEIADYSDVDDDDNEDKAPDADNSSESSSDSDNSEADLS
eukprot:TRINITY_DN12142_c0_g2_i35.p1 TRINITY_DN12142_c0_g2~~TRINITY_DN12142_c0_g2_i35.p1  ORF type:complete len:397 (+),score=92.77 TRINITY_DN12142_c0_g2_i35:84-1274(+)